MARCEHQIDSCFDYIDKARLVMLRSNHSRRAHLARCPKVNSSCRSIPEYSHAAVSQKLSQQYSRQRLLRPSISAVPRAVFRHSALPPQLPTNPLPQLSAHHFFEAVPHPVSQAQPDEMSYLVNQNPWKFHPPAIERDAPLPQKRSRVNPVPAGAAAPGAAVIRITLPVSTGTRRRGPRAHFSWRDV